MSEPAGSNPLRMPSKITMVSEAILQLDTQKSRSSLLELDTQTLADLGLRLTDRKLTDMDAWRWLNQELGGTPETPAVQYRAVNRFSIAFREIFEKIRADYANRIARLSVANATGGNAETMHKVSTNQLAELIAERLVQVDNLEELSPAELANITSALSAQGQAMIKLEELRLKAIDSERKTQKLEADLRAADARVAEITQKVSRIPERIKAIEEKLKQVDKARARGKAIDPAIFVSIREELAAMAHAIPTPAPGTVTAEVAA